MAFGPLLDYRDPALVGDSKYLWEINRHQHLVTLAQAWALTGEAAPLRGAAPPPRELVHALPAAARAELVERQRGGAAAHELVGGVATAGRRRIAAVRGRGRRAAARGAGSHSVHEHMRFIGEDYSLYSSANNHLVGEAAGVFIAALTWPHWPEALAWRATGAGDPGARDPGAERRRRREPRAVGVLPAVRDRHAAHGLARGARQRGGDVRRPTSSACSR